MDGFPPVHHSNLNFHKGISGIQNSSILVFGHLPQRETKTLDGQPNPNPKPCPIAPESKDHPSLGNLGTTRVNIFPKETAPRLQITEPQFLQNRTRKPAPWIRHHPNPNPNQLTTVWFPMASSEPVRRLTKVCQMKESFQRL